jgi:hypothetical protein
LEHVGTPLAGAEHPVPQAPQLFGSLVVLMQVPLQLENPVVQVRPHWPAAHVAVPFGSPEHDVPQAPQ